MNFQYLFGPVPSRRLGISLGIDLVPFKVCSLNCVYCECGTTTSRTLIRKEYVPTSQVLLEIDQFLSTSPTLDYATFSGAGEPLLHSKIGLIASHIKAQYPQYRIALLTNGTLLQDPTIQQEVKPFHLIVPSLDAVSQPVFEKLNRPAPGLHAKAVIKGLADFRKEFSNSLWLEVFIVPGINDTQDELLKIRQAINRIGPDKVQLNSLDRPGVEAWVQPATPSRLQEISNFLGGVEIIAKFTPREGFSGMDLDKQQAILQTISRRPCTAQDMADSLGMTVDEVNRLLKHLSVQKKVMIERQTRGLFFRTK